MDDMLEGGARRAPKKRSAPKRVARRPAPKRSAPKRVARRSAPKRSAPKRSAPKRSAPKRSAPKRSAPKKSVRTGYVYKNGRKYVSGYYRGLQKLSSSSEAAYLANKTPEAKFEEVMTLQNKPPAGDGWKLSGHGYDLITNREEWFWTRPKKVGAKPIVVCKDGKCKVRVPTPAAKGCVRQFTKKYTERPSPPYPASECIGTVKVGNDGKMYISKQYASGEGRWVLHKD